MILVIPVFVAVANVMANRLVTETLENLSDFQTKNKEYHNLVTISRGKKSVFDILSFNRSWQLNVLNFGLKISCTIDYKTTNYFHRFKSRPIC